MGAIIEKIKEGRMTEITVSSDHKYIYIEDDFNIVSTRPLTKPEALQLIAELTEIVNQMEE